MSAEIHYIPPPRSPVAPCGHPPPRVAAGINISMNLHTDAGDDGVAASVDVPFPGDFADKVSLRAGESVEEDPLTGESWPCYTLHTSQRHKIGSYRG